MAETVIVARGTHAKVQSIWAVLGLNIITFGIYGIFHFYRVNCEMRDFGLARGDGELGDTSPGGRLVALLFGWILLLIPTIIVIHRTARSIEHAAGVAGIPADFRLNIGLFWAIQIFTGLGYMYTQNELNKVWRMSANAPVQAPGIVAPSGTPVAY